jgi:hypothetical protein
LHQMRVALRRLRAAVSLFADMLVGPQTEEMKMRRSPAASSGRAASRRHLLPVVFLAVRRRASHPCSRMRSVPTAPSLRRSHFGRDFDLPRQLRRFPSISAGEIPSTHTHTKDWDRVRPLLQAR